MSLTKEEHERRYFQELRLIGTDNSIEAQGHYFETRAYMDIVNHLANRPHADVRFDVIYMGGGMTRTTWSGYFKSDVTPGLIFEVEYDRQTEDHTLITYKTVEARKALRSASVKHHRRV